MTYNTAEIIILIIIINNHKNPGRQSGLKTGCVVGPGLKTGGFAGPKNLKDRGK